MDVARVQGDDYLQELALECENGRLLRLVVKLQMIYERPDGRAKTRRTEFLLNEERMLFLFYVHDPFSVFKCFFSERS